MMSEELLSRFCFHKADPKAIQDMSEIRLYIRSLAEAIDRLCPESREKATAFTQLSFVMMSANSAIVQQCPIDSRDLHESERELLGHYEK